MQTYSDIFEYIIEQETAYKNDIELPGGWLWNMKKHIETSFLYAHSQLTTGKDDFKPVKNITRPILNLQHRTEDIEVKDVQLYVDDPDKYHLSFLVKKYHDDVFVKENNLDEFFDELNVSRIDYGAGLSKQLNQPCPEVVSLQSIAFCDQTDILSGPIGIKHFYSPDQLLEMESKGWGDRSKGATISVSDLIKLSREEKKEVKDGKVAKTPGKYIEIYEVHGNLPVTFTDKTNESGKYETRLFIVAFYQKKGSTEKSGVVLYTALESESPFKIIKRDPVFGRALGFGGAEELFEAQVWVNYDMIRTQQLLDAAAITIFKSTDPTIATKNNVRNMENMQILDLAPNTDISQVDTFPRNLTLLKDSVVQWEAHAQQMGAANDALMGENPSSGTPFRLQELVVRTGQGLHDYRKGQYAKHLEEIYNDWIIPYIQKKICEGARFLSELSLEELQYVKDCVIRTYTNEFIKTKILEGKIVDPQEIEDYKQEVSDEFKSKGNKHFIEILKGEFKGVPVKIKVSIAGKSENLAGMTDKIVNIFRFAFSNPTGFAQVMQIPGMAKSFNEILEYSGLSPADFSGIDKLALQPPTQTPATPSQLPAPVTA